LDVIIMALRPMVVNGAALDVWTRHGDQMRHFWDAELDGTADPGQDTRGAPDPTPLGNILDLTPSGRGSDWYPKLSYESPV
jgi:predicted dithiol-disulfide oxidoreductase (DUF899 family)